MRDGPIGAPGREKPGVIGWALRLVIIWGGAALLLVALVGRAPPVPPDGPAGAAADTAPARSAEARPRPAPPNSLVFRAGRDGHVVLDAAVNGAPVRFLVDTGATMVVLAADDAAAAGISRAGLAFSMRTQTANGIGRAAPVVLRELRIGQFAAADVPAAIVENLRVSLLGQSFLKRLDGYEMREGALTLYWN